MTDEWFVPTLMYPQCSACHPLHPDRAIIISPTGLPYSSPNSFPLSCLYSASVFSLHGGQTVLLKPQPDHICFAPIFKPPKGFPSHFKQNPPRDLTSGPLTPYLPFSPSLTLVSFNLTGRFVVLEPSQHTPPEGVCSCCSLSMTPSSPRYHLGPCPCFFQVSVLSHFLNKASLIT